MGQQGVSFMSHTSKWRPRGVESRSRGDAPSGAFRRLFRPLVSRSVAAPRRTLTRSHRRRGRSPARAPPPASPRSASDAGTPARARISSRLYSSDSGKRLSLDFSSKANAISRGKTGSCDRPRLALWPLSGFRHTHTLASEKGLFLPLPAKRAPSAEKRLLLLSRQSFGPFLSERRHGLSSLPQTFSSIHNIEEHRENNLSTRAPTKRERKKLVFRFFCRTQF